MFSVVKDVLHHAKHGNDVQLTNASFNNAPSSLMGPVHLRLHDSMLYINLPLQKHELQSFQLSKSVIPITRYTIHGILNVYVSFYLL